MPLKEQHRRFVAEYAVDLNATQAAIRAGYSPIRAKVTGCELLKRPEIQEALAVTRRNVEAKVAQEVERAEATAAYVVRKSLDMAEYGTGMVPMRNMFGAVVTDEDGNPVMRMRDWRAGDAALTRLAKMFPEFSEKSSGEAPQQHLHLHGLDDEQLRTLAAAIRPQLTEGTQE